jgi:hypothetical protein
MNQSIDGGTVCTAQGGYSRGKVGKLVGTRYWRGTRDRALSPTNTIAAVASSLDWSLVG